MKNSDVRENVNFLNILSIFEKCSNSYINYEKNFHQRCSRKKKKISLIYFTILCICICVNYKIANKSTVKSHKLETEKCTLY